VKLLPTLPERELNLMFEDIIRGALEKIIPTDKNIGVQLFQNGDVQYVTSLWRVICTTMRQSRGRLRTLKKL
jgi:hypothetical protein